MTESDLKGSLKQRQKVAITAADHVKNAKVFDSEQLTPQDYILVLNAETHAGLRTFALKFLLCLFAFCVVSTFSIIVLQGFNILNFKLPDDFMMWLGGAVIGEVAASLALTLSFLFRKEN